MKKTILIAVPLATILLLVELASAKPIDYSENPDFHDVITEPVAGSSDHGIDSTGPNYADYNMPDFIDTVAPDDKKVADDLNPDKSNLSSLQPISGAIKSVVTTSKPSFEVPSRSPISFKPPLEKPSSLDLKPDSLTAASSITTSEPVSEIEDASSLVTSFELGSTRKPNNLVTTLEPDSSSFLNIGSKESDSLPTTLETDSGRRGNSASTLNPNSHGLDNNKLNNLPVTSEHKNGASDINSSWVIMLLGIFLITGTQVT